MLLGQLPLRDRRHYRYGLGLLGVYRPAARSRADAQSPPLVQAAGLSASQLHHPTVTPVAWSSFLTETKPGKHGHVLSDSNQEYPAPAISLPSCGAYRQSIPISHYLKPQHSMQHLNMLINLSRPRQSTGFFVSGSRSTIDSARHNDACGSTGMNRKLDCGPSSCVAADPATVTCRSLCAAVCQGSQHESVGTAIALALAERYAVDVLIIKTSCSPIMLIIIQRINFLSVLAGIH